MIVVIEFGEWSIYIWPACRKHECRCTADVGLGPEWLNLIDLLIPWTCQWKLPEVDQ